MSAPGWYPDPNAPGQQRWWDGARWTGHTAPFVPLQAASAPVPMRSDSRQLAMAAHLTGIFGFVGPLIFYLVKKDDPFVTDQAREALNFHLSVLLYLACGVGASLALTLILIGFLLLFLVVLIPLAAVVFSIVAAVQANSGQAYRYPLTIRFITA